MDKSCHSILNRMDLKRARSNDNLVAMDSPTSLEPPVKKQNHGLASDHEDDEVCLEQPNPPVDFSFRRHRPALPVTPDVHEPPLTHWLEEGEECEIPMSL